MRSKLGLAIKCLLENRVRFSLTVLSICVAVSSVLLIRSVSSYGTSAVWSELDSLGMNGLIVTADSGKLSESDIDTLASVEGVEETAPVTVNASKVFTPSDDVNALVWGIDETASDVVSFELMYGRFIDKGDIMANRRVCMIDQTLAAQLFGSENALGKTVGLMCGSAVEDFSVIGVVKTGKGIMQSLMGSYFPAFLYAPYSSMQTDSGFTQAFIKTDGIVSSDKISGSVRKLISRKITVTDLAGQRGTLQSMMNVVTLILTVIGGISLLVSGISIMNVMLISVGERTKEIGIKKSIGASCGDIMLDFLMESVIISIVGTAFGIVFSAAVVLAANIIFGLDMAVSLSSIVGAVICAGLLGVIFGIAPAYKASRFKPVEALRR